MIITPQKFFDIFCLCLYWQTNFDNVYLKRWTTVDKVARILEQLKIISTKQREILYKDWRVQRIFSKSIAIPPVGIWDEKTFKFDNRAILLIRAEPCDWRNPRRILMNIRLFLSERGKEYCEGKIQEYETIISKKMYLDQCEKDKKKQKPAAGAIMANYLETVEERLEKK